MVRGFDLKKIFYFFAPRSGITKTGHKTRIFFDLKKCIFFCETLKSGTDRDDKVSELKLVLPIATP